LILACLPPVRAADASPADDCRLTLYARQALLRDNTLEPLNLGVSVKQYVATVWGSAPTKQLADRALDTVRKVNGVANVVDRVTVDMPGATVPKASAPKLLPSAPPERKPTPVSQTVMPTWQPARRETTAKPLPPKPLPAAVRPTATAPLPGREVSLPKAIPVQPDAGPVSSTGASPLVAPIERLCRSSVRYRYLRATVDGGVVRLHGSVVQGEDRFALAQAISQLSGVTRVNVEGVRIDPYLPLSRD
jgi:hypothetical protein